MNRKIRIALAALAALMALSLIGATGVASAASRPTEGGVVAIAYNGVAEAVNTGEYWKSIEAWFHGSSGSPFNPVDDACQGYADQLMDAYSELLLNEFLGNAGGAFSNALQMMQLEDKAISEGCVVLYTPA